MPLFGDACRDEGLYAMHVQTWSNMSKSKSKWWLQNVSALLFGAALLAFRSGFRLECIWWNIFGRVPFDPSP